MRQFFITLLLLTTLKSQAQSLDPTQYIFPMKDVPALYSSNFGEMRTNHFHSGVDIKTGGVEGKTVVAIADGYISRIFLSPYGFGLALYVTHTNGTMSVYGHLSKFRRDIRDFVQSERYRLKKNSIDMNCPPDKYPVKQGDIIAYSGNSGASGGPHLHFEIRDTRSQKTLNTIQQGVIKSNDNIPPYIVRMHYIEVDSVRGVPQHSKPQIFAAIKVDKHTYKLSATKPIEVGPNGYFVLETTDRKNAVSNTFGTYRVSMNLDDERIFEYRMDGFTFDKTRYCNAITSYNLQRGSRNELIRLASLAGADRRFYTILKNQGVISLQEGEHRKIRIESEDDSHNIATIEFPIIGVAKRFQAEFNQEAMVVDWNRDNTITIDNEMNIVVPSGAIYESILCKPHISTTKIAADTNIIVLSSIYNTISTTTPLHKNITISIRASIPSNLQPNAVLASVSQTGKVRYVGGKYSYGAVTANTRTAGEMLIVADTVSPRITPKFKIGANLTTASKISFGIGDNFSGIASYEMLIDGQWVACDYYPSKGIITHTFETPIKNISHNIIVRISDNCNNKKTLTSHYIR